MDRPIVKTGPRGGKIVGYLHGDPRHPIYLKPGMAMPGAPGAPGPLPKPGAAAPDQPGGQRAPAVKPPPRDPRLPVAGTTIRGRHKGQTYNAVVRDNGVEYNGKLYRTISAAAAEIMQHAANGYAFFNLGTKQHDVNPQPQQDPTKPPKPPKRDSRLPPAGETMTGKSNGKAFEVVERENGFHLSADGKALGVYRSLSAAATAATGYPTNGYALFGRLDGGKPKPKAETPKPATNQNLTPPPPQPVVPPPNPAEPPPTPKPVEAPKPPAPAPAKPQRQYNPLDMGFKFQASMASDTANVSKAADEVLQYGDHLRSQIEAHAKATGVTFEKALDRHRKARLKRLAEIGEDMVTFRVHGFSSRDPGIQAGYAMLGAFKPAVAKEFEVWSGTEITKAHQAVRQEARGVGGRRGCCIYDRRAVVLPANADAGLALHEMTHAVERAGRFGALSRQMQERIVARATGNPAKITRLGKVCTWATGTEAWIETVDGRGVYTNLYAGKRYNTTGDTEFLSMGMQDLYSGIRSNGAGVSVAKNATKYFDHFAYCDYVVEKALRAHDEE